MPHSATPSAKKRSPASSVQATAWTTGKQGDVLTVEFTVAGIPCVGLNGGPEFKHNEAFSFQIAVLNIDGLIEPLTANEMQTIYQMGRDEVARFASDLATLDRRRVNITVEEIKDSAAAA